MTHTTSITGPAIRMAAMNGLTEQEGESIVKEVMILLHASHSSPETNEADDRITDLIAEGLFTEAMPMLHADLCVIGLLVERGYVKSTGK